MTGFPRVGITLLSLVLAAPLLADSMEDSAATLVETCRGCHGIEGYKNVYPTYKVPMLAGQNKDYLVIALKAYKSGERSHPTMQSQAKTLSEQDMEAIAAYFAAQGGGEQ